MIAFHPGTKNRPLAGFTLIEMLATVVIIGVLAALLVPAISGVRKKGQAAACTGNMRSLVAGLLSYTSENDGYLPAPHGGTEDGNHANILNSYAVNNEPWELVFPYITDKINAAQKVFYCPANKDPVYGGRKADLNKDWKMSSYYYYFPFDKVPSSTGAVYAPVRLGVHEDGVTTLLSDITKISSLIPKFHDGTGINVGYSDGAIVYLRTEPNAEFYKDILPAYPTGTVQRPQINALAKKFKEARQGKGNGTN